MAFHETLPPRLVELVRQAKDQILARPELFNMYHYAAPTECGTALCIAGHMAVLDDPSIYRLPVQVQLRVMMAWRLEHIYGPGLGDEFGRLFYAQEWPHEFCPMTAECAAARIDYWLETGK